MIKNPPVYAGDTKTQVRSLGREDPLEKKNSCPLQYSYLENPIDRGAWQATVHWVAKSQIRLSMRRPLVLSVLCRPEGCLWVFCVFFLVTPHGMWDLSSLTWDQTRAHCIARKVPGGLCLKGSETSPLHTARAVALRSPPSQAHPP